MRAKDIGEQSVAQVTALLTAVSWIGLALKNQLVDAQPQKTSSLNCEGVGELSNAAVAIGNYEVVVPLG